MNILDRVLGVVVENHVPIFLVNGIDKNGNCTCYNPGCGSPGKHPYSKASWKVLASYSQARVEQWKPKFPTLNIGVATGRIGKTGKLLIVVDIDSPSSPILDRLLEEEKKTFCYKTGGGGYHFWFWTTKEFMNSVSLFAEKIDIRCVNGYVIVPPSHHKSGRDYELLPESSDEIQDIPAWVYERLEEVEKEKLAESKNKTKKNGKKDSAKKAEQSELFKFWSLKTISELRELVAGGSKIPSGIRNSCLHRLLSSDRALGVYDRATMLKNALYYASSFEEQMDDKEIERTVASAMKYAAYNNSHEKVNQVYVAWLRKKDKLVDVGLQAKLEQLDSKFFDLLEESSTGVSMEEIILLRDRFMKANGLSNFSRYKTSLFGAKLRELKFQRTRTSSKNLWKISLDKVLDMCYSLEEKQATKLNSKETQMTDKQTDAASSNANIPGFKKIVEKKVQVKNKKHPLEWKYPGVLHSEYLRDQVTAMGTFDDEEESRIYFSEDECLDKHGVDAFMTETLVGDKIGVGYMTGEITEKSDDCLFCKDKTGNVFEVTAKEIDRHLVMDRVDILYRDGKPYGQPEFTEITLNIVERDEENATAAKDDKAT